MKHLFFLIGLFALLCDLNAQQQVVTYNPPQRAVIWATDSIQPIPKSVLVKSNRDLKEQKSMGLSEGNRFPDVPLYRVDGYPVDIKKQAKLRNKPVLLISGSLSCPIFRGISTKIDELNRMFYANVDIYVVYIVEAHPDIDESPYKETEWQVPSNEDLGTVCRQAKTYGDRLITGQKTLDVLDMKTKMLFDGPDNRFWLTVGQAPVFSYLINVDGYIDTYQFNFDPEAMQHAMEVLLSGM